MTLAAGLGRAHRLRDSIADAATVPLAAALALLIAATSLRGRDEKLSNPFGLLALLPAACPQVLMTYLRDDRERLGDLLRLIASVPLLLALVGGADAFALRVTPLRDGFHPNFAPGLFLIVLVVMLPQLAIDRDAPRNHRHADAHRRRSMTTSASFAVAAAVMGLAGIAYVVLHPPTDQEPTRLLSLGLAALLEVGSIALLARAFRLPGRRIALTTAAASLTVCGSFADGAFFASGTVATLVRSLAALLAMVAVVAVVCRALAQWAWPHWRPPAWVRPAVVVAGVALLLPVNAWGLGGDFPGISWREGQSALVGFADGLLVAGVGLLVLLAYRERTIVEHGIGRPLAISIAALGFYVVDDRFLYVPVSWLVGIALVYLVLLHDPPSGDPTPSTEVLREALELARLRRAARRGSQAELDEIARGTLTVEAHLDKAAATDVAINRKRAEVIARLGCGADSLEAAAFDRLPAVNGRPIDRWQFARRGARVATVLSAPWMVLSVLELVRSATFSGSSTPVEVASQVVFALGRWPLYGWFFGYFYDSIRGRSGLTKGAMLFVTLAVPYVVLTRSVTSLGGDQWGSVVLTVVELFLTCIVLGLVAGDLGILRAAQLGPRSLLDVHELRSLVVWGSGVALAAGSAVGALLASGVVDVVVSVLRSSGIAPPTTPNPTGR